MNLAGLRVLVTRPQDRADELLDALHAAGAATLHLPALEIAGLDDTALATARQTILELDRYDALIFISVNAVQFGLEQIENLWPQLPAKQTYFAIGAATAKALEHYGLRAESAGHTMNSESLLEHPALQQLEHQRIAIVRGVGGRETLAQTLRQRGARVDYIECYQRSSPKGDHAERLAAINRSNCNCTVVNSGESLQNLTEWLPKGHTLFNCPIITPGERVAALAQKLGYAKAIAAQNAGLTATLDALQALVNP